jgi:hypothetical protein
MQARQGLGLTPPGEVHMLLSGADGDMNRRTQAS